MHPDCEFLSFSNGTLFDEEFCDEILRVKNFVPAFSLEGSEEANDGRRGEGIYQKVMHAMKLLKDRGLPFGVSTCYTGMNVDSVSSEEYFDKLIDCGALFAWFFHYMPVGKMLHRSFFLHRTSEKKCIMQFVNSEAQKQSLRWISRMMLNLYMDVLQVEDIICILMQMVMWSLVYSSIIQTAISKILLFWTH